MTPAITVSLCLSIVVAAACSAGAFLAGWGLIWAGAVYPLAGSVTLVTLATLLSLHRRTRPTMLPSVVILPPCAGGRGGLALR